LLNLNDLRVELLQSAARDLLFVCFSEIKRAAAGFAT
jgi:hypothetical protein